MPDYESTIFQPCKEWIANELNAGKSWDDILSLGASSDKREEKLADLIDDFMWPEDLSIKEWEGFVADYKITHITVSMAEEEPVIAIDNGIVRNYYPVPVGIASSWAQYKSHLKTIMSADSVTDIQKSCVWVLNHLSSDSRKTSAVKGLVTGSVQSGKTANMEGLVSMAADYDWNFFIILSGTIDNLRKQTRDRFKKDLSNSEGILWRILDFTSEDKRFGAEELKLNPLTGSKNFSQRNSVTIPVIEEMANFMLACFDKMTAAQTELILELARNNETISRRDVIEFLRVSNNRANYLLRKMKNAGSLMPVVIKGRGAKYKAVPAKQS